MAILIPKNPAMLKLTLPAQAWATWRLWIWCMFLALFLPAPEQARAQTVSHEYAIKAVFLLNFARFTDWPAEAFEKPDSPFVIGILGENPFGSLVDDTVRGEEVNQHQFIVKYYRRAGDIQNCNMLFISQSEHNHLRQIVADLKNKPVLTVAESPKAVEEGVCVQFLTQNNKIRLRVNLDALKAANLTMSSELLRLSDVVSVSSK